MSRKPQAAGLRLQRLRLRLRRVKLVIGLVSNNQSTNNQSTSNTMMALAILSFRGFNGSTYRFEADLGSNRFWRYRIGQRVSRERGLQQLEEVYFESPVSSVDGLGRLPFQTSFSFEIPASEVQMRRSFVQLFSYSRPDGSGPAISNSIELLPSPLGDEQPVPMLSMQKSMNHQSPISCRNVPQRWQESRVSALGFWDFIGDVVSKGVPIVAQLIGGNRGGGAAAAAPALVNAALTDAIRTATGGQVNIQATDVNSILQSLLGLLGGGAAAPAAAAPATASPGAVAASQSLSIGGNGRARIWQRAGDDDPFSRKKTTRSGLAMQRLAARPDALQRVAARHLQSGKSSANRYSEAKIAPAVLAAVPAIAGVVEKIFNKDVIDAISNSGTKLFSTLADNAVKLDNSETNLMNTLTAPVASAPAAGAAAGGGIAALAALLSNPNVTEDEKRQIVERLMAATQSTSAAQSFSMDSQWPPFLVDTRLRLLFFSGKKHPVLGSQKRVFVRDRPIILPVQLRVSTSEAPKTAIPKVIARLCIKHATTNYELLRKTFKLKNVPVGSPIKELMLLPDELKQLPTNLDLRVHVELVWPTPKGRQLMGVGAFTFIQLADLFFIKQVAEAAERGIALNDVAVHRPFWHKIVETGNHADSRRWSLEIDTKYLLAWQPEAVEIGKMESKIKPLAPDSSAESKSENRRDETAALLKSGMELNPTALNTLLPMISKYPSLSENQLAALKTDDLNQQFQLEARTGLRLHGRGGTSGSIWVYPEMDVHRLVLQKITAVDGLGQVVETVEENVFFPRPSALHFIGTTTTI